MTFVPIFLSKPLDKRASQTFLRKANLCRRSGFLYAETKGAVQTVEMVRGSVVHSICERATTQMIELNEMPMPPELIKPIVNEVLAESPLPLEEHDYVRELAYRWATEWMFDPTKIVACETLFVLDVAGWEVRCKVDFAESRTHHKLYIADYKSGRGAPPWDDIARKRPDGTMAAKNFQLILYALALVFGQPVEVVPEPAPGAPAIAHLNEPGERRYKMLPWPGNVSEVEAEFVYPGIEDSEGKMLHRPMTLTRLELEEYRESLAALVQSVESAEQTGDWPAIVSDAACNECPCSARCPIPSELRDHRGTINTMQQLSEAAEVFYRRGKQRDADRREIKAAAKHLGGPSARVRFGLDRVWELGPLQEKVEIRDREGMFTALESGEPFDRSEWTKVSKNTPFAERALSEDELEEEHA